jgi:4-hydroxy-3-methylbut-2-en-1-yl diphosphate reductase
MRIIKAEHLGMCFGVRDAIELAKAAASRGPVTVLGELVHNENVLQDLRQQGIRIAHTAVRGLYELRNDHRTWSIAKSHCRLRVTRTSGFRGYVSRWCAPRTGRLNLLCRIGCHPVIIGKKDHVEVKGLTEDLLELRRHSDRG